MSDSIPSQWISQHIIKVAETFGKSFTEVPIDAITPDRMKRVQIIEFLTYNENTTIWGRVSDKESVIPVCFTKAAVSQYMKEVHGRRLTEAKNAVFCIGQLRPIFVQIPVGNNRPKFTEELHIALEVGDVKYIGPALGVCGSPQDVELNTKVKGWVRGLRRGGDGGDVLKCKKQDRRDIVNSPPPIHEIRSVPDHPEEHPKPQVRQPEHSEPPVRIVDPMREFRKRWMPVKPGRLAYTEPCVDDKVKDEQPQLGQLPVQESRTPDVMSVVPKSQPCTPPRRLTPEQDIDEQTTPRISEWSPSVRGSPAGVLPCSQPNDHETAEALADENLGLPEPFTPPATSSRPPTPAQRVRRPSTSKIRSTPTPYNSSFMPAPSSSSAMHIRRTMMRKIPHPGLPPSPTNRSGSTQILVPNSDTSGTQSQSQSQSQNHSQSHPRSQLLSQSESHRPAFPSQLTQEFKPGETSTPAVVNQGRRASKILSGDRASSPGITVSDVREGLGHNVYEPPGTSSDARQAIETSVIEVTETDVHAVNGADVAVLRGVSSQVPEEPSNESKPITASSPVPLHSPLHSLFSGSSRPSASKSRLIPHVISRATSPHPAEPIASTSRALLHDAEAWKQPSFMSARKSKSRGAELNEKPYKTHKRKRLSPSPSSPFTSQKRRKFLQEKTIEPHPIQPANEDEKSTSSSVSNEKANYAMESIIASNLRKESSSIKQVSLSGVSTDINQSQEASSGPQQPGYKKRKPRLLGFQADFDHIPVDVEAPNPRMTMRQIRTILLRTGRIRTLGDEVTRDGSIYSRSD
ncbi:hypothetical protein AZE42_01178 [Rhizopogon vesiculosus]|uniref:Shelterin complex subunit TPP1/Est3 domain-containing protein n=1 Tax=Rhizopogon vesiculosus TaxID=180088 RepID=A0A1J8PIA4_9AGAM|nr:hypothetical protein AZE42_01178 [Rhizopogon vesiculosus]